MSDTWLVNRLFQDSEAIMGTALAAQEDADLLFLVGPGGAIRICEADWTPLDRAIECAGAQIGYRVRRRRGYVEVEGRQGSEYCLLRRDRSPRLVAPSGLRLV